LAPAASSTVAVSFQPRRSPPALAPRRLVHSRIFPGTAAVHHQLALNQRPSLSAGNVNSKGWKWWFKMFSCTARIWAYRCLQHYISTLQIQCGIITLYLSIQILLAL
jgi:hypothetical protein